MQNHRKKSNRTDIINLRVTPEQKEKARKDANAQGMTMSQYISHLIEHPKLVVLQGGKELAEEVYNLNMCLSHWEQYPMIPIKDIQSTIGQCLDRIHAAWKESE